MSANNDFSRLYNEVINTESNCAGCGVCVAVCPNKRLIMRERRPAQATGEQEVCPISAGGKCGLCAQVCPRLNFTERTPGGHPYGECLNITVARSAEQAVREKGQDGGFVSSIMQWGLRKGVIQAGVGCSRDEDWNIVPAVMTLPEHVKATAGSKYTHYSIDAGFNELVKTGFSQTPFALVGLPCHITAVRRLQNLKSKLVRELVLTIGLFCSKSFDYKSLITDYFNAEKDIEIKDVQKMDIKRGRFIIEMSTGEAHEIPIKELTPYACSGCRQCKDFAADDADISVGGLGIGGWSAVLTRNERGGEILREMIREGCIETCAIDEFPKALPLLEKMSAQKRG